MDASEELRYVAEHLHHDSNSNHNSIDTEEKRFAFQKTRRYSKAEEAMHENDRPLEKGEEPRFSSTDVPSVVTTPYIWGHSVHEAPDQLHLLAKLRKEDEEMRNRFVSNLSPNPTETLQQHEDTGRRPSFGEGGLGDHSAKVWDWPLGEHKNVEVHSDDHTFEASFDFRPFQPNEIWAKVMGDDLTIHCKSEVAHPGTPSELVHNYTLPLNCDARTARFHIKFGHTLVVTVDKVLPIKLAVATFGPEELKKHKSTIHAEFRP